MNGVSRNNVVVIGGGPVGLFTAIQAKLNNKNLNIFVLDKNNDYARTQSLRLDGSSFWGMATESDGKLNQIIADFKKKKMVPIQEIVCKLKKYAEELGISFEEATLVGDDIKEEERKQIKTALKVDDIVKKYSAGVVIGADGAHSKLRQVVFKDEFESNSSVEYFVQYAYCVNKKPEKMGAYDASIQKLDVETVVHESHSRDENRVSLRFIVDKTTFDLVKDAKAKKPWKLEHEKIPGKLRQKVTKWKRRREELFGEKEINNPNPKDPAGFTAFELKVYHAKKLVAEEKGTTFCLVGDAASGVPYFRSINKGFKEAIQLGKAVAHVADPEKTKTRVPLYWVVKAFFFRGSHSGAAPSQFKAYASFAKSNARWEATGARIKTFFIDCFIGLLKIGGKIGLGSLSERAGKLSAKRPFFSYSSRV